MMRWAPPAHLVALTSTGPRIANKSTYAAENGPSCGSRPDPSPAITIENSPRAPRATPAGRPQRASRWLRHAAQYPVHTLASALTIAKPVASGSTVGNVAGSICSPEKKRTWWQRSHAAGPGADGTVPRSGPMLRCPLERRRSRTTRARVPPGRPQQHRSKRRQ